MVDAILKEAAVVGAGLGKRVAIGRIYEDVKRRWPDGTHIRTSTIVDGPDADGVIQTLNTSYRLELASK